MRFRMAQCLCKNRHAIFGMAVHDPETTDDELMLMLQQAVYAMLHGQGDLVDAGLPKSINRHCGICGEKDRDWIFEVARSKEYPSWEEAQIALRALEKAQQRTHELMDLLGMSYDSKRWKNRAEKN